MTHTEILLLLSTWYLIHFLLNSMLTSTNVECEVPLMWCILFPVRFEHSQILHLNQTQLQIQHSTFSFMILFFKPT